MTIGLSPERGAQVVVFPASGNLFSVALRDLSEAIRLAPIWLHSGWIDVVWRFRRTRIGPFWHTLSLAAFVLVMGTIWSIILRQDPIHYFRYVTVSMMVWGLISSFITEGTGVLIAGQSTALSMHYPYAAFAFAHVWRSLLLFGHHLVFYIFVMAGTLFSPGWPVVLALPALLLLALNGVWMSLLAGVLCLRWRDLVPATSSAMQIAMFVTPIFWSKEMLGPKFAFAANYNPLYHLVLIIRDPLLGNLPPHESWIWSAATFVVGSMITLLVYGRCRDRLPYWY